MPTLYVLAGANGVGKTTLYQNGIGQFEVDPNIPFINVDTIVFGELGAYTPENLAKGEELARERMKQLIQGNKDFIIESNLSKSSDYDWIALMRKNGYETVLFFLGTNDVELNKVRVKARVEEGGHDVAEPIIEQRYSMGLTYLKPNILLFYKATLFDASNDDLRKVAHLQNGEIFYKDPNCPEWANKCLKIAERLKEKARSSLGQTPSPDAVAQQKAARENQGHARRRRNRRSDGL